MLFGNCVVAVTVCFNGNEVNNRPSLLTISSDCIIITYRYLLFVTFYVTYGFVLFSPSHNNIFNVNNGLYCKMEEDSIKDFASLELPNLCDE
jgi:hypothetical protein